MPYLARSLSELAARGSETAMNYLNRPAGVQTDFYTRGLGGPALLLSLIQLAGRVRARVPRVHRVAGGVVLGSIVIAGNAGPVLSTVDLAGAARTAGLGTLTALWVTLPCRGIDRQLQLIFAPTTWPHDRDFLMSFGAVFAARPPAAVAGPAPQLKPGPGRYRPGWRHSPMTPHIC
jgi:hypothetical protein